MDLRSLDIFCRVVERQSFTAAARELDLAQASVSERIAALESDLGLRLLDRLGRSVTPTPAGERLYAGARELLRSRDALLDELAGFGTAEAGTLKIAASTIPAEYFLPDAVARFVSARQKVRVTVHVGDSDEVCARVLSGEAQLGVVGAKPEGAHLRATALWRDRLVAICPPKHPLASPSEEVPLSAFLKEPMVLRESGSGTRRTLEEAMGRKRPVTLNVAAEFGSTAAVKRAVSAGLGVSVVSAAAVALEVQARELVVLDVRPSLPERRLWAVVDSRRESGPLGAAFLEFLGREAGGARGRG